jgi:hypothetical protein
MLPLDFSQLLLSYYKELIGCYRYNAGPEISKRITNVFLHLPKKYYRK